MEAIQIEKKRTTRPRKSLLPYTFEDRLGLPAVMRLPATFDDFVELLVMCEYKVEYSNGDIVSILETHTENNNIIMGLATLTHEQLVMYIGAALINLFSPNDDDFTVLGSNMPTFIAEGMGTYNPDVVIVKGVPETKPYKYNRRTQKVLTNPWLVVEVLSQGTREYDLVEKFANYRRVPTLKYIIFVEQYWTEITVHTRQANGLWTSVILEEPEHEFSIADGTIRLSDIYRKIKF
jgi:Uma2 family endonuclease